MQLATVKTQPWCTYRNQIEQRTTVRQKLFLKYTMKSTQSYLYKSYLCSLLKAVTFLFTVYSKQSSRQETFFVFHQTGYSAYNPSGCYTKRQVHSSFGHLKYIPEELDAPIHLCDQRKDCNWGPSVNVQNKFLYIAQPTENRVVVIDAVQTMNPVEVML